MTDLDDLARYNIEIWESDNEEQKWNKINTNFTINETGLQSRISFMTIFLR